MLKEVVLLAVVAVISGQAPPVRYRRPDYYRPDGRDYGLNYVEDLSPKPYSFNYNALLDDGVGSSSRTEDADGSGRVVGSYTLTNDEGHSRVVDYVADAEGFRASIRTNEPGTANQSPANVNLESTAPAHYDYRQPEHRGGQYLRRRPVGYRAAPQRAPLEEPVVIDQPVDQPAAQPIVNGVPRRPAFYDRNGYRGRAPYRY